LEAGAARALDTKVAVSGSRLNFLKPSYGVASVSGEGPFGDPPFFSAASVECRTSWRKLLNDVLTVESVRIEALAINLSSENGRWNIEGLGGSGGSSEGDAEDSMAWHLERLEIDNLTLRVRMEEDESVHSLKGLVLKGIGSTEEGFSVEELTEIAVGLVFDQLAQLVDSTVTRDLLSSTAHDLLPQSLDAELTSRMEELESKIGRGLGRIQRDLEGATGKLGEELQRLLSPPPGKD